ncbi:hypothetical protein ScalyP_jg12060 [Parmales sp. scaly parma]|nr:hypothetical protein ScalyP_jg12060 [Parmales sp. scaly parma]|tara:strand:+ start:78 stop:893 length:816 start_codon:yes stop_codon:yes gene_type:complete
MQIAMLWDNIVVAVIAIIITVIVVLIMRSNSAVVYDKVIIHMTALWYATVIDIVPINTSMLDIGIGTATALLENAPSLRSKKIKVKGVDYNKKYVAAAQKSALKHFDQTTVSVHHGSVYDVDLLKLLVANDDVQSGGTGTLTPTPGRKTRRLGGGTLFETVYFSGSFSLMPDPIEALRIVGSDEVLAPGGAIMVTQTYQTMNVPLLGVVKPLMKFATTIDFGELTFEEDVRELFVRFCQEENFKLETHKTIDGSVDNIFQKAYLTVLRKTR